MGQNVRLINFRGFSHIVLPLLFAALMCLWIFVLESCVDYHFFTIWYFIDNTMCSRVPLKRLNKTRLWNRISVLIIIPRQVSSFELCLIGCVHLPFSLSDIEPKEVILDFFLKILNRTCIAWKVKSCSRPIPHSNIMKISMNQFQVYLKSTHS